MRNLLIISILFASYCSVNCKNKVRSEVKPVFQDSLQLFESSLNKFVQLGFKLKTQANDSNLIVRWKEILKFSYTPSEAVYIALGDIKEYDPDLYYSDNCWHFDVEAIEGEGSYKRILENLRRISNNDLNFENIKDYCNDNEDGKAWVSFEINSDKYKWDLKVDDDYADIDLFDKINSLLIKYGKAKKLTYFSEGQSCVFSYLSQDEFDKFNLHSGIKIEWLNLKQ